MSKSLITLVFSTVSLSFGLHISLTSAVIISCLFVLLVSYLGGVYRRTKYSLFLRKIGTSVDSSSLYAAESVMAAIPFESFTVPCRARIEGDTLLFGRVNAFRGVKVESIESLEFDCYFGHQIAKVALLPSDTGEQTAFYIPWSELLENQIELKKVD
ncbi:hypothetical protein A7985_10460 [Pseudoalteromonas luteoviolacea]|uniref:Uncharacterized protein n=2 Tax=Pseudoalteromonas luteoviolacea TaxID=43657 RepID=A0A1C0TSG6_9GAMM|nr:hypothetical protein A7985_10460 [Pseudoalteromonas luteoviolacea]